MGHKPCRLWQCFHVRRQANVGKLKGATAVNAHEALQAKGDDLSEEHMTAFRALAARANYLALDRPDCAFACKELCRQFNKPPEQSFIQLKKACPVLSPLEEAGLRLPF